MSKITKPEVLKAAEHIVNFPRRTYPRKEMTLVKMVDGFHNSVATKRKRYVAHNIGGFPVTTERTDRYD